MAEDDPYAKFRRDPCVPRGYGQGVQEFIVERDLKIVLQGRQLPPTGVYNQLISLRHFNPRDWIRDPERETWAGQLPADRWFRPHLETRVSVAERVKLLMSLKGWDPESKEPQAYTWLGANADEAYELFCDPHSRETLLKLMRTGALVVPGATMVVDTVVHVLAFRRRGESIPAFELRPINALWPEGTRFLFTMAGTPPK